MFSALPMPQFDWNEKNMRYAMCAFPLIGVVIGAAWCVCGALPLPGLAKAAGFALVPVWAILKPALVVTDVLLLILLNANLIAPSEL